MSKSNLFTIEKQTLKTPEQAYSELLGSSPENQIVEIPLSMIDEIENQPCKIHEDKVNRIVESMRIVGQLDPVIVIPSTENKGRYILLAGRHRSRACQHLGFDKIKAVIKQEKDADKQRLMLLATNNDRNTDYLPSELAFSYLEQKQLLEKFGSKSTVAKIAEDNETNRKSVHKYIQLTKLNSSLLHKIDTGEMTVGAGYELSFLTQPQQQSVNIFLINHPDIKITKDNARLIREAPENLNEIFFSDDQNVEQPKAEKKTKNKSNNTSKCPSEGHLQALSSAELNIIGLILYKNCYSIFKYIVSEFSSTDDVTSFIKLRYGNSRTGGSSFIKENETAIEKYKNSDYLYDFRANSFSLSVKTKDSKEKYTFTFKELDSIIRRYLRQVLKKDDILLMLRGE